MKRTPFRRKPLRQRRVRAEGPTADLDVKPWAAALSAGAKAMHRGTYAGGTSGPAPKSEPYRDQALRDMPRGRQCLLLVPAVCNHRLDTTVGCHSNLGIHGKAGARKADDCYMVDGCAACHAWLDTDRNAPAALKEEVFMAGLARQVLAWHQRAADSSEPERFRRAARRVIAHLNATPLETA